jgi:hypothetical protein
MKGILKYWFNRARRRADEGVPFAITTAEKEKFSVSGHVRVESQVALADYSELKRSLQVSTPDLSPLSSPPGGREWELKGFMGLNGYLDFTGGTNPEMTTANLELWAQDSSSRKWFLVASKTNVAHRAEFRFENAVRHRSVFLRVSGFTGTAADCAVACTAE